VPAATALGHFRIHLLAHCLQRWALGQVGNVDPGISLTAATKKRSISVAPLPQTAIPAEITGG